ncbi:hypothetical protein EWJ44_11905 [Salmonella enterica subsp. enterica serovar Newport]|uniref:Uncharacterized protein n=10 Tax=Salmonella enterica TaxID=28901 RepID=A0A3Y7T165_SALAN|nr:hypothetical protein [Salmonella enterica subsp. enterica serovar Anatum]EAA1115069.1 hypothetical protein [Salmonella enterica subsp. enterica serovar Newport]EAA1181261.1 hypothetical protein [Salmonella enterica subsp. enterica serovar Mikawasima]EAA4075033.1 hypothetical protein [Salmonella enterica subsp. enterica serovar Napoli]EAA5958822.1 hypothetical protein [Salmonella enterica subsp. enterica serovar Stanleyville]EAA9531930.1 hypothetical protein [Salmonella enterica subsp. enter
MSEQKTHYRKAFDSPYLSSADIVEPTILTIARVALESDKTKKTKDVFNTAYFEERELRPGEKLKPMILNATNSKTLKGITGSPFLEDWRGVKVTVFVDKNVRFGKESVEGLRISPARVIKPSLTPEKTQAWSNAKAAYRRDGNLDAVKSRMDISPAFEQQLIAECTQ